MKPVLDDAKHLCIRNHSVRFSKIRAYVTYSLVFEDEHVRTGVVHLVFYSQTLEQQGVFENVRVINDLFIFEEHLMHH